MSKENSIQINELSINPVYLSARSAIVKPEQVIPTTIYSLKKWLPRLGTERWSLVQLLRGLCLDAPRRTDGTKRVTISWRNLAGYLQVHEETVASWLKHEVIPDDKPWRHIIPSDDYAKYLGIFIPRLKYAYETRNGKTRRVGFLLEILMEDPIAPEDEMTLAQQVELLQLQQGELKLNVYQNTPSINPSHPNLPQSGPANGYAINTIKPDLPHQPNPTISGLTSQIVNPENLDLQTSVKQNNPNLAVPVASTSSDLPYGKSDEVALNVNKLKILINQLKQLKYQKRNYQQILEPIISLTETLLNDYHSTAMLYMVLKVLFPDYVDIYISAVEQALITHTLDASSNRGAIFVSTLRQLADSIDLDLGFKKSLLKNLIYKHLFKMFRLAHSLPPLSLYRQNSLYRILFQTCL